MITIGLAMNSKCPHCSGYCAVSFSVFGGTSAPLCSALLRSARTYSRVGAGLGLGDSDRGAATIWSRLELWVVGTLSWRVLLLDPYRQLQIFLDKWILRNWIVLSYIKEDNHESSTLLFYIQYVNQNILDILINVFVLISPYLPSSSVNFCKL